MRYFCLVSDYDGTIAGDGLVAPSAVDALKKVRASGRKIVLATGRELPDLQRVFPELTLFDRVVAENGGLLYRPAQQEKLLLTKPPSAALVEHLQLRGVPVSVGGAIISTWRPNETAVLEAIQSLGLDLQITFNKGAAMVLPSGVNKSTGVRVALAELGISPHNAVGVGDAENDHGFVELCECAVAVENAIPALKETADMVTAQPRGAGVEELCERLLANDLADADTRLARHRLLIGHTENGENFYINPFGTRLAIAGPSGSGKSTFVSMLIEQLVEHQYQVCVIDPEGDFGEQKDCVTLGRAGAAPDVAEMVNVLEKHAQSVAMNLLGVAIEDRPAFFQKILSSLQELRARRGRPQWIVIDEAHHLLPATVDSANMFIPSELSSLALVTVHLNHVSAAILDSVNGLVVVGREPREVVKEFNAGASASLDTALPQLEPLASGTVAIWMFGEDAPPQRVIIEQTKSERRRHRQKYAAGELGQDKSFYFRGPELKLNLRAQNMMLFAQLAEGVDDDTWSFHLKAHDYSRWLRESVKDQNVADEVGAIEEEQTLTPGESRERILGVIRKNYTAPA